jgi:S-adenosylmethionine decarboxylase
MTKPFAPGTHLLVDFDEAKNLQDAAFIELALRDAAAACGATVLQVLLHHFGEGAGVTGVALLAESHISIHTWPDTGFAAIDIFLCGRCDPHQALPILRARFLPGRVRLTEAFRGAATGGGDREIARARSRR